MFIIFYFYWENIGGVAHRVAHMVAHKVAHRVAHGLAHGPRPRFCPHPQDNGQIPLTVSSFESKKNCDINSEINMAAFN